jgi:hypothetical protein
MPKLWEYGGGTFNRRRFNTKEEHHAHYGEVEQQEIAE